MNDYNEVWLEVIRVIVPTIAAITAAIIAWRGNIAAKAIAVVAEESALVAKDTADKTHVLVNSNMQIQLEDYLSLAKRLAERSQDPIDIQEVERAKKRLDEHISRQKIVDQK